MLHLLRSEVVLMRRTEIDFLKLFDALLEPLVNCQRLPVVGFDQSWLKNEVIKREYNNGINTVLWECIPLLYS